MEDILLDKRTQSLVLDYVPQGEILEQLVCFFTIFSDYTRLKILSALAISEMCVSDLTKLLKLNQTTVSHQLRLLKNLNAVKTSRQGKIIFYSLRNETLNDVLLKGVEFLGYWRLVFVLFYIKFLFQFETYYHLIVCFFIYNKKYLLFGVF